jgi:hypothetical protein
MRHHFMRGASEKALEGREIKNKDPGSHPALNTVSVAFTITAGA